MSVKVDGDTDAGAVVKSATSRAIVSPRRTAHACYEHLHIVAAASARIDNALRLRLIRTSRLDADFDGFVYVTKNVSEINRSARC